MPAILVGVADAVRAELQTQQDAGAFGALEWTPARSYGDWDMLIHKTTDLRVDVVLSSTAVEIERQTQFGIAYFVPVDIGIRKKLMPADDMAGAYPDMSMIANESIDELVDLTEAIAEYFAKPDRRLAAYADAIWESSELRTVAFAGDLREHRQYTGIVRTTWRVDKELDV